MSVVIDKSKLVGVISGEVIGDLMWSGILKDGVDKYFHARQARSDEVEETVRASQLLIQDVYKWPFDGRFRILPGYKTSALYSKNVYNYLSVGAVLPNLDAITNHYIFWIGFERDASAGTGIITFIYGKFDGTPNALVCAGGGLYHASCQSILNLLPSDVTTRRYVYSILVFDTHAEFYITEKETGTSRLVGIIVNNSTMFGAYAFGGPPYAVVVPGTPFSTYNNILLELMTGPPYDVVRSMNLAPYWIRGGWIEPTATRTFRFMRTNTYDYMDTLTGVTDVTSHPVPFLRRGPKTILFQSSAAGTLEVQVLGANGVWRILESRSVSAGAFTRLTYTDVATLIRIRYYSSTASSIQTAELIY